MTCLAYDGKTLVADGMIACGHEIIATNYNKIFSIDASYIGDRLLYIALAGRVTDFDKVVHGVVQGLETGEGPKHECEAIVIGEKYVYDLEYKGHSLIRYERDTLLSAGSGGSAALNAMRLGLNALAAVKHACKYTTSCGGRIRYIKL